MTDHVVPFETIVSKTLEHGIVVVLPKLPIFLYGFLKFDRDTEAIRRPTKRAPTAYVDRCAVGGLGFWLAQQLQRRASHALRSNIHTVRGGNGARAESPLGGFPTDERSAVAPRGDYRGDYRAAP